MKTIVISALLASFFWVACTKQAPTSPATNAPASGANPLSAPGDYGKALVKGKNLAAKTVDVAGLKQAIQMFQAQEGRNPKDLQELVSPDYLPKLPEPPAGMKFSYNPSTGEIKVVPK